MKCLVTTAGCLAKITDICLLSFGGEFCAHVKGFSAVIWGFTLFNTFVANRWLGPSSDGARRISVSVSFMCFYCAGANASHQHRRYLASCQRHQYKFRTLLHRRYLYCGRHGYRFSIKTQHFENLFAQHHQCWWNRLTHHHHHQQPRACIGHVDDFIHRSLPDGSG